VATEAWRAWYWLLDVEFKDDLSLSQWSRRNMVIVRRFALGLVRANKTKGSVKKENQQAGTADYLLELLQLK
jgi:hypothetical protein